MYLQYIHIDPYNNAYCKQDTKTLTGCDGIRSEQLFGTMSCKASARLYVRIWNDHSASEESLGRDVLVVRIPGVRQFDARAVSEGACSYLLGTACQ